jgi:hypothetical protein
MTVFLSIAAVLLIRAIAVVWLHPVPSFVPLQIMPPILDTAVLVIWAVVVFAAMVRFVSDPIRKFKAIAFIVLLLSFLPDIALVQWRVWGATWSYVFALMAMHIAAWVTCVNLLIISRSRPWKSIFRILLLLAAAAFVALPMAWKAKIAFLFVIAICTAYGIAFNRLRKRRIGSAAVGSFYDMLEQDKRRAVEVIVEEKATEQAPEDAEGSGPDMK